MQIITTERVPIKIWSDDPEPEAVEQLKNVARMPFVFKHIAAMPDVHFGFGSTVGSVIATKGAVIPAAVGVDIGCGMMAWNTGIEAARLKPQAHYIREALEEAIPVGFNAHQREQYADWPEWQSEFFAKQSDALKSKARVQLGTLGGGNHFIELAEDETGTAWAMLHSGSRGIGKLTADVHMNAAKEACLKYFVQLPDKDLAYLVEGTPEFDAYIEAVKWCQGYAWANRLLMMNAIRETLELVRFHSGNDMLPVNLVHCHHNYVTQESHFGENVWLTRKGAVCAREGMKGIIPGSMGTRSYIVEGLGNRESFHSCSHGAGRRMGRNQAKRTFTLADLEAQTEGVDCRKDIGVLDELPGAYKDIDVVMANQTDLVRPIHTLKQFLCIKG